jgi:16S rRNA (cytosine1402-N4)-methyltransferase
MNVENVVPMRLPPSIVPPRREPHVSVLSAELVAAVAPREGGLYVDATLGAGGHAEQILAVPGTRVVGVDRDPGALALASARLERFGDRARLLHGRFSDLKGLLASLGVTTVDGLYADVGVSSMQIDDPARGMSFRAEGPLDMRMDRSAGETALDLIDRLDDTELADVIFRYGDERRSRRVARCIKQARDAGDLATTLDLRRAVVRAVGPARHGGVDPATRTFQALRIAVNGELTELEGLLAAAPSLVAAGGVFAVIAFHSLEDRLVKHALRERAVWQPISKKPIVPSDAEMADNPRSRSAKLRAAHRLGEESGFSAWALDDERSGDELPGARDDEADA